MKPRANAGLGRSALASVLLATVLLGSALPCPEPPAGPGASDGAHHHGSEAATSSELSQRPEQSLHAPCYCGCGDTSGADRTATRLPASLLVSAPALPDAAAPARSSCRCDALPEAPDPLIEHVPRPGLA